MFAFRGEFEYFQGDILGCQIFETEIKKWTKIPQISTWALMSIWNQNYRRLKKQDLHAQLNDDELDDLVEGAQAKSTEYDKNYAVSVFKGNFSVKILPWKQIFRN